MVLHASYKGRPFCTCTWLCVCVVHRERVDELEDEADVLRVEAEQWKERSDRLQSKLNEERQTLRADIPRIESELEIRSRELDRLTTTLASVVY